MEEAEEAELAPPIAGPTHRSYPAPAAQEAEEAEAADHRAEEAEEAEEAEAEVEVEAALEALEPVQAPPAAGNTNLHQSLAMPRTPPRLFGTLRIALW